MLLVSVLKEDLLSLGWLAYDLTDISVLVGLSIQHKVRGDPKRLLQACLTPLIRPW